MESYGKILLIAMPAFLLLVLFEKWYGHRHRNTAMNNMDTISSLASGVTNVTKDVLGLSLALYTYSWMAEHWALTTVRSTVWTYIIAFFALDFAGYCIHRIQHTYNFFWNGHIIHHSSEEFDLACALRQSVSSFVKLFTVFLLPAALLGVPEKVIAIVAPLHLFAQFWYHTVHINKMGFLEKIIVTPSHHRVHHAINPEYLDKNYGQIFIFWDKLFGTFQEERPEIKPVYGITRPVRTWNPFKINFMHMGLLAQDAWRTKSIKNKLKIWMMPTGWRPEDVAEKYPVYKIADVQDFERYRTKEDKAFTIWCWFQVLMLLLFVSWLFGNIVAIGSPGMFIYGGFVFLFVYALTDMMDGGKYAVIPGILPALAGVLIIIYTGDWFGAGSFIPGIQYVLLVYFLAIALVPVFFFKQGDEKQAVSELQA
ncbi:MAG: sterol desaturase family protein [Ferruginibacter sp.]